VLGHWSFFPHQLDAWFGNPSGFAFWALGGFAEFVFAEFEAAFFAGGYFDDRFVVGVLERLEEMLEVFDGVFAGLIDEARDFGDGHGAVEEHGD
jgi:hypothetical protein